VGKQPNVLVVHPSLPVKSVKDLVALAKRKPGELNYGSGSTGSSPHIAGELFKSLAEINIVRVNYKGAGPALVALVSGEVHMMFPTAGSAAPHIKSGKLQALAVTSAQPSPLAPGLPTMAAAGIAGYESIAPFGIFAPARTPAATIKQLSGEIAKVVNQPDVKQRFLELGIEIVGSTPDELARTMKTDMVRITRLVEKAGLRSK
jgi:tripartite-type tricarboxylate transporter receptor subunit TctC